MGRGRSSRTLELVEAAREILEEIQPAPVRAVCYKLFVEKLISSMARSETARVSRILVEARERGEIPWRAIVDETREAERPGTWADPTSFADVAMSSFRRDRWQYQPVRVEVWSEKGTVRGTLAPILHKYGVTLRVFHGFSSATSIMEFIEEIRGQERPLHALYVGDHDPSGLFMSEQDLPSRLAEYGAHVHHEGECLTRQVTDDHVDLQRIALTRVDCETLPSFDVEEKRTDPRFRWYVGQGHKRGWELDAMSPPVLRARVEDAIVSRIDTAAWERTGLAESAEQASLREILGKWPGSISRQVAK